MAVALAVVFIMSYHPVGHLAIISSIFIVLVIAAVVAVVVVAAVQWWRGGVSGVGGGRGISWDDPLVTESSESLVFIEKA